jgi:hypothetical protein
MRSRIPVLTFALEEKYCQHYSVTKMRIEGRMGLNLLFAVSTSSLLMSSRNFELQLLTSCGLWL